MSSRSTVPIENRNKKINGDSIETHVVDEEKHTKPELKQFSYNFFSPEVAHLRALYFKIVAGFTIMLILIMWICLPVYWGSLWKASVLTKNMRAWVINYDDGIIGETFTNAIMATTNSDSKQILGWQQLEGSLFASGEDIANAIVDERSWVAVVIEANATSNLATARATGDSSFNPTSAISVYLAQGRNEIAVGSYVQPIVLGLLNGIAAQLNARSAAQYLGSIAGNDTALQLLTQAPQTISQSTAWTINNVRPYTHQVANAITLVGQIYAIIFAFFITMAGSGAREPIARYLRLKSYLALRIVAPMLLYIPISLAYAMINLPFKLPFDAKYSYAGGFFIFWILLYVGMCALGMATEAVFTILGPQFMGFFLIPYIIINVSVTVLPNELQVWFYKYGLGFPVYNMSQGVRTIIFNTKNHLGRNFSVLIAWTVLSIITTTLFTILMRRKEVATSQASVQPPAEKEK